MKEISIRELHLETGRWVKLASGRESIIITHRGTPVATLTAFDHSIRGKPLPNRWDQIKKMPRIAADSTLYVSEMRDRS